MTLFCDLGADQISRGKWYFQQEIHVKKSVSKLFSHYGWDLYFFFKKSTFSKRDL